MKAVIIANGVIEKDYIVKEECSKADVILCADSGAEHAYRLGIMPNYVIGDFDSIDSSILKHLYQNGINIIKYPCEKDFTDTELCIIKAIEIGCTKICFLGMMGKRIDHALGNIGLLHFAANRGVNGYIVCDDWKIYICKDKINLDGNIGDIVSIIPFKGDVSGVYTKGLKYPLKDSLLEFGRPLGVSNVMLEEKCEIGVKSGEILVIKMINR